MTLQRPDLTGIDPQIVAYIEALEAQLAERTKPRSRAASAETPFEPSEPPTTLNIITITSDNHAKRTPRHLYARQRRGGMGVFDIETDESQPPVILAQADESATLLLFSDQGRAFRLPVSELPEAQPRARGVPLGQKISLLEGERLVAALAEGDGVYVLLLSERGWVRRVQRTYLGPKMYQGQRFHKMSEGGYITAAAWSSGQDDVFIVTRSGLGIRFSERQIPGTGCLGIRIAPDEAAIGITSVAEDGGVYLQSVNGKGTIRLMSGFRKNKAPGAGGKVAMKTERVVGVTRADASADLFVISRLSKLIRFSADDVPVKTGVVQGVNCIALRSDEAAAVLAVPIEQAAES